MIMAMFNCFQHVIENIVNLELIHEDSIFETASILLECAYGGSFCFRNQLQHVDFKDEQFFLEFELHYFTNRKDEERNENATITKHRLALPGECVVAALESKYQNNSKDDYEYWNYMAYEVFKYVIEIMNSREKLGGEK
jgi:hypothetical protein